MLEQKGYKARSKITIIDVVKYDSFLMKLLTRQYSRLILQHG